MDDISVILLELLSKGRAVTMVVTGGSMCPFLRDSIDRVTMVPFNGRLKVCDIALVLRPDGAYVLHRIVKIKDGSFTMLGDAQTRAEGPYPLDRIVALVSSVSRNGREIATDGPVWRGLSFLWLFLWPVRATLIRGIRRLKAFGRYYYESLREGLFQEK